MSKTSHLILVVPTLIVLYTAAASSGSVRSVDESVGCADSNATEDAVASCVGEERYLTLKDGDKKAETDCKAKGGTENQTALCIGKSDGYINFHRETCECNKKVAKERCGGEASKAYRVAVETCSV